MKTAKKELRTQLLSRMRQYSSDFYEKSDNAIFQNVIELPEYKSCNRILCYCSIGNEIDTRQLIDFSISCGKEVALPTALNKGKMDFALIDCDIKDLPLGPYNIPAPPSSAKVVKPKNGDIIIVPAIQFDIHGYRLGRGGGYYDRYLKDCNALSIGLCREIFLSNSVPRENHDIRVDRVVTENAVL